MKKKVLTAVLTAVMVLGLSVPAMASTGKGNGISTAPGQATNFSKGITTVVTNTKETSTDTLVDIKTNQSQSTESKSETSVDKKTTIEEVKVNHPQKEGWYRFDTVETTVTTTTTLTWDETTTVTTTTTTTTPVTIVDYVETTLLHHGAPGSNGVVISQKSNITKTDEIFGEPIVDTKITTEVVKGEVTSNSVDSTSSFTIEGKGWIKN